MSSSTPVPGDGLELAFIPLSPSEVGATANNNNVDNDGRDLHLSTSQLNVSTCCGIRWVPLADGWVITGHKLTTTRLTDLSGLG